MSKIKEVFGVEIGEKFTVDCGNGVEYLNCYFRNNNEFIVGTAEITEELVYNMLAEGTAKIVKPILTKEEHDYLQAVCKPYKIGYIAKHVGCDTKLYIKIHLTNGENIVFPNFYAGSGMYNNMDLDKDFTPEELGIKL